MQPGAALKLAEALDREIGAADRLLESLEEERRLLSGGDPEALQTASVAKERLLRDFEQRAAERRGVLEGAGYGAGREEMVRLLRAVENPAYDEAAPSLGPLASRWRRLLDRLGALRDANERNGMIIGIRSRQVRQVLNLLRTGRPDELTYGPAGGETARPATRALGRA